MTALGFDRRDLKCDLRGKEIFEIIPIILSGNPTDLRNKTALRRIDHIKAVNYWNSELQKIKESEINKKD